MNMILLVFFYKEKIERVIFEEKERLLCSFCLKWYQITILIIHFIIKLICYIITLVALKKYLIV